MLSKIYFEITNVCNLSCPFCHGTRRAPSFLERENFLLLLEKIKGHAKYLYFHVLGEPLLHADLPDMMRAAKAAGFSVMLTTNGTLLCKRGEELLETGALTKISVSLQALESGGAGKTDDYLAVVSHFAKRCGEAGVICVLRLWNEGSESEKQNAMLIEKLHALFPDEWIKNRSGFKLIASPRGQNEVYLEFDRRFAWPDIQSKKETVVRTCRALSDQIGILCDGTVVPCCMDADGEIKLGNLYTQTLDEILSSPRAAALLSSFQKGVPCEALCASCGYAARFSSKNKH